jgi:hypothetical protein
MFTKIEIAERLAYASVADEMSNNDMTDLINFIVEFNDDQLKEEVKERCGSTLMRVSYNQYIIN